MRRYFISKYWALVLFMLVACKHEENAQSYFLKAVNEFKTENYQSALELFSKAIENDSAFAAA